MFTPLFEDSLMERNPLGYSCAPNEGGADVTIESDLGRFLAFGFVLCHDTLLNDVEGLVRVGSDVYWLRNNFLDAVQIAKDALPLMIEEANGCRTPALLFYSGDQAESGFTVPLAEQPEGASEEVGVLFEWTFNSYDPNDRILQFDLWWFENNGESDRVSVWLAAKALAAEDANDAIERAMASNVNEG